MRDLDRFSKRRPVSRLDQTPDAGIQVSWLGTFCRLAAVLVFIGVFSWGVWKLSQPANIWTSSKEIQDTESKARDLHRGAEKDRREMEAPRAISVESLVHHVLNIGYELTDEERLYVQKNWNSFVKDSNIDDDQELLFRLRMRRAKDGTIEDYPLEEWKQKNEERKRAEEEKERENLRNQAMMLGVQEIIQKSGKSEESRIKAEDQEKRRISERRSNREMIRNVIEEAQKNMYSGKPIDAEEPEHEEQEAVESEPEEQEAVESEAAKIPDSK